VIIVVADTSVYVSALVFGGVPQAALIEAMTPRYRLAVSTTIQDELTATLAEKFGWPLERINRAGQHLWANALWCEPLSVRASRDPDDDHILGCALAAEAAVIVTGDKDLLALHPFRNTAIVTPARFLDLQVEATVLMKETRT
jgi:putative PIN family toxin of toxin-antitoxin system